MASGLRYLTRFQCSQTLPITSGFRDLTPSQQSQTLPMTSRRTCMTSLPVWAFSGTQAV